MLTIHRPLVPSVVAALTFAMLVPPGVLAADASDKTPMRATAPAHVDAAKDHPDKDHPARVRPAPRHASEKTPHDAHDKVNINTADVKELMTLTGVGRKVAEKIVEYRDNHGPFKKADELRKVDGVGNGVWERNRDRVVTK